MLLENDPFLTELTKMFERSKSSGSLTLTVKRYDGRTKPKPRSGKIPEPTEYKCLIRASLGNKKIATVVNHKDVTKFQMAYGNVLKGRMDGLKRKEKKGTSPRKKTKAAH